MVATLCAVALLACSDNTLTSTQADPEDPAPPVIRLSIEPQSATVPGLETVQFSANVQGGAGTSSRPVVWTASGGSISSSGVFRADGTEGTYEVAATVYGGVTDSATVHVTTPRVAGVRVSPGQVALEEGKEARLTASPIAVDGSVLDRPVTWAVSDPLVATVDGMGAVTAVGVGGATITATSGGATASVPVTVAAATPTATLLQLVLSPDSLTLVPGATAQFSVAGTWSDGSAAVPAVTYSATGGTITAGGLFAAGTTPGTFRVIATQQNGTKADTAVVTVTATPTATLLQLVLSPASITLVPGGTAQFSVAGTWSDGSAAVPAVTYSATGGTITAGGLYAASTTPGTFQVIATSEGVTGVASVSVTAVPVASVAVSPASVQLEVGGSAPLSAEVRDAVGNTLDRPVSWSASSPAVAAVDGTGLVTAVAAGSATITASCEGKATTVSVTVSPTPGSPVASVEVAPTSLSLTVGEAALLSAVVKGASGKVLGQPVSWISSNTFCRVGGRARHRDRHRHRCNHCVRGQRRQVRVCVGSRDRSSPPSRRLDRNLAHVGESYGRSECSAERNTEG